MAYYIVSENPELYTSEHYTRISIEESLAILEPIKDPSVDTETTGFNPHSKKVILLQIGNHIDQIAIDTETIDATNYKEYLEREDIECIMQNAKFDLRFLFALNILVKNVYDTFLAETILYLGYPAGQIKKGLDALADRYLNVYLPKSEREMLLKYGITEASILYGCRDIQYLSKIKELQMEKIESQGLTEALKMENKFVRVLAYVEYCGIHVDREIWESKMAIDAAISNKYLKLLEKWVMDSGKNKFIGANAQGDLFNGFEKQHSLVNWTSPESAALFFKAEGYKVNYNEKGSPTVDIPLIKSQKKVSALAGLFVNYKQAEKVRSTYGQSVLNQMDEKTGRVHTNFNQIINTTRLSSGGKDSELGEETLNLQNMPADYVTRAAFFAQEGNMISSCDYTAQEDLVFTEATREPKLIEFYNDTNKRDGHSFVAKMCFPDILANVPEKEVKYNFPNLRQQAKSAKFAIHYGGNGFTITNNLGIDPDLGDSIYKSYLEQFTGIDAYFKYIKAESWRNEYILVSPITGHKRYTPIVSKLKQIHATFNRDFWDAYKKHKEVYVDKLKHIKKSKERNKTVFRMAMMYADGHDLSEICDEFSVDVPFIMVEVVRFFFRAKSSVERDALNTPIQGTSAQITKLAGIYLFDWIVQRGLLHIVKIINLVHDEIILEFPVEMQDTCEKAVKFFMEKAAKNFVKVVTLKAEPLSDYYWRH